MILEESPVPIKLGRLDIKDGERSALASQSASSLKFQRMP